MVDSTAVQATCIIDGEAIVADDNASPPSTRLQRWYAAAFLYAFDLIELNGDDLRRDLLEVRKATSESVLAKTGRHSVQSAHRGRRSDGLPSRLRHQP